MLGWKMSKENNGGPAYPTQGYEGLTVRDYFAAKAMQGEMSGPGPLQGVENIAARAYAIADAMLKAREGV